MAIAIRSSATLSKTGSDSTSHTLTLPPTIVEGDRLLLVTSFDDSSNTFATGLTAWTSIFNGVRAVAYEKIADATDVSNAGATFGVTSTATDQQITAIYAISGAHASTASLYSLQEHDSGDGTTYPFASCTGWTGEEALFVSGVAWDRSATTTIPTGPTYSTSHTQLTAQDTSAGTATSSGITTQYYIVTTASLDPSDWTGSASRTATDFVIAVRPGAALTKKLKLFAHSSAASVTNVAGVVYSVPTSGNITGATKYGEFTGKTFEASLDAGQAVLKVDVADFGGAALLTSDTPVALVRNSTNTTGIVSCTVIEE